MSVRINIDKRKLESAIKNQAEKELQGRSYDVECPHCHATFSAKSGRNLCPRCHTEVDLNLNINF